MTEAERYKALAITYAEDRSRTVERANQVVADLGFAMPDALGAWATRDERTIVRLRQVVEIALFRLYRSKRRRGDVAAALAPALVGYTTAPEDYDHDYVKTVETFTVPHIGGGKDRQWRKIEVYDLDRFQNFQVPRYHSGFHGFQERDPREEHRESLQRAERWREEARQREAAKALLERYAKEGRLDLIRKERATFDILNWEEVSKAIRLAEHNEGEKKKSIEFLDQVESVRALMGGRTSAMLGEERGGGWSGRRGIPDGGRYLFDITLPTTHHLPRVRWTYGHKIAEMPLPEFLSSLLNGRILPIDSGLPRAVAEMANKKSGGRVQALGVSPDGVPVWATYTYGDPDLMRENGRTIPKTSKLYQTMAPLYWRVDSQEEIQRERAIAAEKQEFEGRVAMYWRSKGIEPE